METIRLPRASLFAALVAAGSAASSAAQSDPPAADPSVSVSAPRAVQAQPLPLSPFSVLPDPVQSAGFRTSLSSTGSPQKMQTGDTTPPPGGWPTWTPTTSNRDVSTTPPAGTAAGRGAVSPAGPTAYMPAPVAAPAWRWHGYGGVMTADVSSAPRTTLPSPTPVQNGSAVSAIPTGPEVSLGIDVRQPNPVPAFTPPVDVNLSPLPSATAPQPLPAGEPAWKPVGGTVALANPMSAGPERWLTTVGPSSSPIITVSATGPAWRGPAVTLDAPRAAGTYISRGVSDASAAPPVIRPASYAAPAPVQRTPVVPAAIRTGIERVAAGRGRDLNVSARGPASLLVRLRVRHPADAEYLANAISRMPELAPYQVQFEMQVAR